MTQADDFYIEEVRGITLGPVIEEGGAGTVHAILGDPDHLAKVYHAPGEGTRDKLAHMVSIPIELPPQARVAWPRALLRDASGAIRGYTMDNFRGMCPLSRAYDAAGRRGLPIRLTFYDLARAALNISHAVRALHAQGVVVGDLNDSNLMVGLGGDIGLVDAAAFQLQDGSTGAWFACEALRSAYDAPESRDEWRRTPEMDSWALAILIFRLLMDGEAPLYPTEEGEELVGIPEEYSDDASKRPLLDNLTPDLRAAFRRTFADGCTRPEHRTTPDEWSSLLETYCRCLRDDCPVDPEHYFVGDSCAWCALSPVGEEAQPPAKEPRREPGGPPTMSHARRAGTLFLLVLGFVAAWYVAGRLGADREALSSNRAFPEAPPRNSALAAAVKESARPASADAQISCGSALITVPRADGGMPWPCPSGMVGVPGGPFVAGCTGPDCAKAPLCSLRDVQPFCIAEMEATVRDYERCVEDEQCEEPEDDDHDSSTYGAELPARPVNMVSWHDAAKYCAWLSTRRAFKGWTTRLPTSDEWEKAGRGVAGNPYSWGAERLGAANLRGNDDSLYTANVGKFSADRSPYGALDMIGNVAEWVSDARTNRAVVKGGSFASSLHEARGWTTRQVATDTCAPDIGFRCVAVHEAKLPP